MRPRLTFRKLLVLRTAPTFETKGITDSLQEKTLGAMVTSAQPHLVSDEISGVPGCL